MLVGRDGDELIHKGRGWKEQADDDTTSFSDMLRDEGDNGKENCERSSDDTRHVGSCKEGCYEQAPRCHRQTRQYVAKDAEGLVAICPQRGRERTAHDEPSWQVRSTWTTEPRENTRKLATAHVVRSAVMPEPRSSLADEGRCHGRRQACNEEGKHGKLIDSAKEASSLALSLL